VGAAFGLGSNHGYVVDLPVAPGSRQVCAYAVNVGPGVVDPLVGCRTV
jgi:hypothetical protein